MQRKLFILFSILIPVLISFPFMIPRYTEQDDSTMLHKYLSIKEGLLSVMTFNIRFDGVERDLNNHFTKRVYRLTETIEKWQPAILAVQEPFAGQLLHWESLLPKYYQHIGYQSDHIDKNLGHSSSHMDFQVAILYNNQLLNLVEQDYIWLSNSPRTVGSKDWDSSGARTLNIARFQLKNDGNSIDILVFNTHLDVKSEQARQEQAKIIRSTIKQWQNKYPTAVVLLFGDFNSVPIQPAYNILTFSDFLHDPWAICKSDASTCVSNEFSSTFHAWLGSIVNTYGAQFLQTVLFTFHGSGVRLPNEIPKHFSSYLDILKELWKFRQMFNLSEMISLWSSHRFHVDWILYQNSIDGTEHLQPRFTAVVDIRNGNYSSDHFPIVALFQLAKKKFN
jgi:endonuclease/exonuclease/phosphatase family metal-dependent hydrolase